MLLPKSVTNADSVGSFEQILTQAVCAQGSKFSKIVFTHVSSDSPVHVYQVCNLEVSASRQNEMCL